MKYLKDGVYLYECPNPDCRALALLHQAQCMLCGCPNDYQDTRAQIGDHTTTAVTEELMAFLSYEEPKPLMQ